jgi:hypothetical protein
LDDSLFIAEGVTKKCYHHPSDSSHVIKIIKGKSGQHKRYVKRVEREIRTFKQISLIDELKNYFPQYHGTVSTNLGVGYLFDKVENIFDVYHDECFIPKFLYIKVISILRLIVKYNVPCCPDLMRNIFVTHNAKNIYFLDGVGCKYVIPITMSPFPNFLRKIYMSRIMRKYIVPNLRELRSKVAL